MKFHENSSSGSRVVPCGRTDITDGHTDLTKIKVAFRNFANVPKKLKAMDNVMCIVMSLLFSNTLVKSAVSAVRVP